MNSELRCELGHGLMFEWPFKMSDKWRKKKVRKLSVKELRLRKLIVKQRREADEVFMNNWRGKASPVKPILTPKPISFWEKIFG
jgi:hypothetical protein